MATATLLIDRRLQHSSGAAQRHGQTHLLPTQRRPPFWAWFLACLCALLTLLVFVPANWFAWWVAERSDGHLILADASGTLWQGSAVLSFANDNANDNANAVQASGSLPTAQTGFSLPGRLAWQLEWPHGLSLPLQLRHDAVLEQPLRLLLRPGHIDIADGQATVPLALVSLLGAPLNTLRLQGTARFQWAHLSLPLAGPDDPAGTALPPASGSVRLSDVSAAVNAAVASVRPLGAWRIDWQTVTATSNTPQRVRWQVTTEQGPLQLQGQGAASSAGANFTGSAALVPGTSPLIAQRLQPLLNALGQRRVPNGAGSTPDSNEVMIRIGS
jgi:general secretion pathway protein N